MGYACAVHGSTEVTRRHSRLETLFLYLIPILSLGISALFFIDPYLADDLAQEDYIVENVTAAAALIAAVLVVLAAFTPSLRGDRLTFVTALAVGLGFFIIAGEEISWGQRIFNRESNEFFLEHNIQGETNFHNLHTHLFMAVFHVGLFVILIVAPIFKDATAKLLERLRLGKLIVFLPRQWLAVVYASSIGFITLDPTYLHYWVIILITIPALGYLFMRTARTDALRVPIMLTTVTIFAAIAATTLINYEALGIRPWFYSEWREMITCITLALYGADLWLQARPVSTPRGVER